MMIYVSGKITGDKNYKLKFEKAANKLISFGYDVFNPAILPNGLEYEQYMQIDFLALSFCQGIYLLDDWEQSSGAKRELEEAKRLGLKVITEDDFMYSDTLVQICNDTENIIESDADQDFEDKVYDKRLQKITNMVRTAAFFHDLSKTKEENFEVNSLHTYIGTQIPSELSVVAVSDDGQTEVVEAKNKRFFVGIKYHPELLAKIDEKQKRIFERFVDECKN